VSGSPLERLINHDFRLDILCCLADEPLPVMALSARLNKPVTAVAYHLKLLEDREVVQRVGDREDDDALYVATLDETPWIAEAIADHTEADPKRSGTLATLRAMVGTKCDGCERLLQYKGQVVAVYEDAGKQRAKFVTEDSPGSGEAASLRASAKYHGDCYEAARMQDPSLPPIED
jgi:DNA-binding transcriptional ArsR family regulator